VSPSASSPPADPNDPNDPKDLAEPTTEPGPGYTIDQLEAGSGVPARTIRFYRQSGLIASPVRIGRQAFYDADQLPRLRLIAALRARGLALDAVSKVLADPAGARESFGSLLYIRDELLEPWIDDRSATMSEGEVLAILGSARRATVAELTQHHIIEPSESMPGQYDVGSVTLLNLAAQLMQAGAQPEIAYAAWMAMRQHIGGLADELVSIFVDHSAYGFPAATTADDFTDALRHLRPIALRAVQLAFALEIERALETLVETTVIIDEQR
jgi:DNA-binding transcriptional MerR regulator